MLSKFSLDSIEDTGCVDLFNGLNDGKRLKNEWVTMSRSRCIRMGWRLQWKQLKTKRYTKTDSEEILNDIEILFRYYWRYKCVDLLNGLHEDKRLKIDVVMLLLQLKYDWWFESSTFRFFFGFIFFSRRAPPEELWRPPGGARPTVWKPLI